MLFLNELIDFIILKFMYFAYYEDEPYKIADI